MRLVGRIALTHSFLSLRVCAMGQEGIPRGLKPHSLAILSAWAKAQAYLRNNSKSKSNNHHEWVKEKGTRVAALPSEMRGFFAALRMTT